MSEHIRKSREERMKKVKRGRNEEECELDRLGDSRQHCRQRCRKQKSARNASLFALRRGIHRKCRAGESEDHKWKFTRHKSGRGHRKDLGRRTCKLGKKDILRAHNEISVHDSASADSRLPKRQIKNVVKPERNEHSLDETVDRRADIARIEHKIAEREDALLNKWPNEEHKRADGDVNDRRNDRDKPRAAKKGDDGGELDLIKFIMQCGNAETDDYSAENAHLERIDADDLRDASLVQTAVRRLSCQVEQSRDRGVHNKKRDRR